MLIGPESPLTRVPLDVHPRQRLFVDAIRYSIAMLDVAYLRLHRLLVYVSKEEVSKAEGEPGLDMDLAYPRAFLDAFSIVDMTNRLWTLLNNGAGMKRTPEMRAFLQKIQRAEEIRNGVQHLPGELIRLAARDEAVWGWLHWIYAEVGEAKFHVFWALPGSIGEEKVTPTTEGPRGLFRTPVDQIELSAYGYRLSLTYLWDEVAKFVPMLEGALAEAFKDREHGLSDILLRVEGEAQSPPDPVWLPGQGEPPRP